MNPEQERDFIERQVNKDISRRRFIEWATKAGIGSAAAMSLSGAVLAPRSRGSLGCGAGGHEQRTQQFARDTLPVGAVSNAAWPHNRLSPDDPAQRGVSQSLLPSRRGRDPLPQYAANDRAYKPAALVN